MNIFRLNIIPKMAFAAMIIASYPAHAQITMSATYYTIAETDQDMNVLAPGVFTNEVRNQLGPLGLPVLNTAPLCDAPCFTNTPFPQDLTADKEITWWSPALNNGGPGGTSDVVLTGTGTITLPYNNPNFFPPNGTGANDAAGFQAAVFSTVLNLPTATAVSFNLGADDDAFVYLDGNLVCSLGGVHANSPAVCGSPGVIPAGLHTLQLFFADIENANSSLTFNVLTAGITGGPAGAQDGPFQISYAANLNIGDSVVNISNDGFNGGVFGAGTSGNLCVNAYIFDPREEEIGCCACLVTPNGLNSLSVKSDLISNNLTPDVPTSIVIKLVGSFPTAATGGGLTVCNPATVGATPATVTAYGLLAWGTTLEPSATPGNFNSVAAPFLNGNLTSAPGSLSIPPAPGSELAALTALCSFIQADGSGFGLCKSCRLGALGGGKK